jgi:hypothetical protein
MELSLNLEGKIKKNLKKKKRGTSLLITNENLYQLFY